MNEMTLRDTWESGIDHELAWWRNSLASSRMDVPEEYRTRLDPAAPLQPHIAKVLPRPSDGRVPQILDCAAGPMTTLGKTLDGQPLAITAIDALADHYAAMLDDLGLEPPVPTLLCEVEHLDQRFDADRFDLVYMRFALDHCYDPLAALRQMVRVTRPGGVVMVEHYRDEAETEYKGLRQWDLIPEADDLVVANARSSFSVGNEFPELHVQMNYSSTWLTMILRTSHEGTT